MTRFESTLYRSPTRNVRPWIRGVLTALVVQVSLLASSAGADWLVTRDGERLETAGPWEVKGKLVVFRLPGGEDLTSLRLAKVDLEASREETRKRREEAKATAKEPTSTKPAAKEPVLVLTDADVGHVDPASRQEASGAEDEPQEQRLVIVGKRDSANAGGTLVSGQVRNDGEEMVTNLTLRVALVDEKDEEIASTSAQLSLRTLQPGQVSHFEATFPGVVEYSKVTFNRDP